MCIKWSHSFVVNVQLFYNNFYPFIKDLRSLPFLAPFLFGLQENILMGQKKTSKFLSSIMIGRSRYVHMQILATQEQLLKRYR